MSTSAVQADVVERPTATPKQYLEQHTAHEPARRAKKARAGGSAMEQIDIRSRGGLGDLRTRVLVLAPLALADSIVSVTCVREADRAGIDGEREPPPFARLFASFGSRRRAASRPPARPLFFVVLVTTTLWDGEVRTWTTISLPNAYFQAVTHAVVAWTLHKVNRPGGAYEVISETGLHVPFWQWARRVRLALLERHPRRDRGLLGLLPHPHLREHRCAGHARRADHRRCRRFRHRRGNPGRVGRPRRLDRDHPGDDCARGRLLHSGGPDDVLPDPHGGGVRRPRSDALCAARERVAQLATPSSARPSPARKPSTRA